MTGSTNSQGEYESTCTCAICMDELGTDLSACPCGHVYHSLCIRTWIKQKRLCPQCKCDALPLATLKFNLFQVSHEERQLSAVERASAVRADFTATKLGIENEQAEINVLEPELAQLRIEERAYMEGIKAGEERKLVFELELEKKRFELHAVEERRKLLVQELEDMRSRVLRVGIIDDGSMMASGNHRRAIHASEVPKLVSFLIADHKKYAEIESERVDLEEVSTHLKSKLNELHKKLKSMGSHSLHSLPSSLSSMKKFEGGFVPSDVLGTKRRLDEQISKQLEKRKPSLNDDFGYSSYDKQDIKTSSLETLSALVSLLSDDDSYELATAFDTTQMMDVSSPNPQPIDLTN